MPQTTPNKTKGKLRQQMAKYNATVNKILGNVPVAVAKGKVNNKRATKLALQQIANLPQPKPKAKGVRTKAKPTPQQKRITPTLTGKLKVIVTGTQTTWFIGVNRFYNMPTTLTGYIVAQRNNVAKVYVKATPTNPAYTLFASTTGNPQPTLQYVITTWL